jgi:hypothetical protein
MPSLTTAIKDEDVVEVVQDDKWSLINAVLIYGTADQAQWISGALSSCYIFGWMNELALIQCFVELG